MELLQGIDAFEHDCPDSTQSVAQHQFVSLSLYERERFVDCQFQSFRDGTEQHVPMLDVGLGWHARLCWIHSGRMAPVGSDAVELGCGRAMETTDWIG